MRICANCGKHRYARPLHDLLRSGPRPDHGDRGGDVSDLWALERAKALNAAYHVLGGVLSPLEGVGPDDLTIRRLVERVAEGTIRES